MQTHIFHCEQPHTQRDRDKWDEMNNKNKQIYPVYVVLDKQIAKFLTTIRKQIFLSWIESFLD